MRSLYHLFSVIDLLFKLKYFNVVLLFFPDLFYHNPYNWTFVFVSILDTEFLHWIRLDFFRVLRAFCTTILFIFTFLGFNMNSLETSHHFSQSSECVLNQVYFIFAFYCCFFFTFVAGGDILERKHPL